MGFYFLLLVLPIESNTNCSHAVSKIKCKAVKKLGVAELCAIHSIDELLHSSQSVLYLHLIETRLVAHGPPVAVGLHRSL